MRLLLTYFDKTQETALYKPPESWLRRKAKSISTRLVVSMDQMMGRKTAEDITTFIASTHDTQDLHFLASQSLQKWVDSLKDGVPNGYEKFKIWLEIRGDLLGKVPVVTAAQDPPALPVAPALVKNETVAFHQPVFLKVTSTSADSISAPAWLDVPPPHSRKRKAPPCEPFLPPSTNKPNIRLSGAESTENLDGRSVTSTSAVPLVVVPDASTPSNSQLKNLTNPIKKIKVESTEEWSLSHSIVCSAAECEQTATSSSMVDSHANVAPTPSKRISWTPEMDDRLREAVLLYKDFGWKYVAQHCGGDVTAKQCQWRYNTFVQYEEQDIIGSNKWTDAEISALEQLVQKHTIAPCYNRKRKAMTQERIDWASIGRELGRRPRRCSDKWDKIQRARNSTESAVNVTTTEPTCSEYAATACFSTSSSSSSPCSSSDDESSSSSSSRSDSDSDSDSDTSSGSGSCSSSQSSTLSERQSISVTGAGSGMSAESSSAAPQSRWTEEEDERLKELVALHPIQPHWDERRKVMTQERIDWTRIAKELNSTRIRCRDRWRCLESAKLKAGPFTEEENILIECFVREWGNKGNGMWVRLEKDLGRPSSTIRKHWLLLSQRNVSTPIK